MLNLKQLPTSQFVDLSTSHLTKEDAELLRTSFDKYPTGHLGVWAHPEFGYLLHVGEDPEDIEHERQHSNLPFSDHFWNALKTLSRNGIHYVRFDRDADTNKELPTFDW